MPAKSLSAEERAAQRIGSPYYEDFFNDIMYKLGYRKRMSWEEYNNAFNHLSAIDRLNNRDRAIAVDYDKVKSEFLGTWTIEWAEDDVLGRIAVQDVKRYNIDLPIKIHKLKPAGTYELISSQDQLVKTYSDGYQSIPTSKIKSYNGNQVNSEYSLLVDKQISNSSGVTLNKSFQTLDARNIRLHDDVFSWEYEYYDAFYKTKPFSSSSNKWSLEEDFDGDEVGQSALDVHYGIDKTIDYYYEQFNRNSMDNNGSTVLALIGPQEISRQFEAHSGHNAMSSGSFNFEGSTYDQITFLDGLTRENGEVIDIPLKQFMNLSTVGHELTHNVTDHEGGLTYQGLSGALNEGFSDIFGATIVAKTKGNNSQGQPDWEWISSVSSEEEDPEFDIISTRTLYNPGLWNNPDTYQGDHWVDPFSDLDHGGVHTNSAVFAYWYVLGVEGSGNNGYGLIHKDHLFGSHENYTNDNGYTYDVKGIGLDKMQGVVYHTLTDILIDNYGSEATFEDAREATIEAAQQLTNPEIANLYPGVPTLEAADVDTIIAAWNAVGVGGGLSPSA